VAGISNPAHILKRVFGEALLINLKFGSSLYLQLCRKVMRASPTACVCFYDGRFVDHLWGLVKSQRWFAAPLKTLAVFNACYAKCDQRVRWLWGDPLKKLCDFWVEAEADRVNETDIPEAWKFVASLSALSPSLAGNIWRRLRDPDILARAKCPSHCARCIASVYDVVLRSALVPADEIVVTLSRQFASGIEQVDRSVITLFYDIWLKATQQSLHKGTFARDLMALLSTRSRMDVYDERILRLVGTSNLPFLALWGDRAREVILNRFADRGALRWRNGLKEAVVVREVKERLAFLQFLHAEAGIAKPQLGFTAEEATEFAELIGGDDNALKAEIASFIGPP
jgi:hypothetical protein